MSKRTDKKWIRGPADELALEQGCWFDPVAAERPILFVERFCRQSKGQWAGKPLTLLEWQRDFTRRLYGWKRADGLRRYRRAYLEVAKKNGKSTLISGLGLELLVADGEGAPEIYLNAYDKEQASIIYDECSRMVRSSPDLSRRLEPLDSKKRIYDPIGYGKIQGNSADVPSKDGFNAHAVIFDELHRQRDRALWDIFEYASESRLQPLHVSITTAGDDEDGIWHEQREYSDGVNSGAIPDITHLGVVYRAMPEDDIDSPDTWRKANPSLGITLSVEEFQRKLDEAKRVPRKLANFLRLRLNILQRRAQSFLPPEAWEACRSARPIRDLAPGQPWVGGLDLSSVQDLTSLAVIPISESSGVDLFLRFWLPEANIVELEHKHGMPYRQWAQMGLITLTPGNVVDYEWIRREINKLATRGECRRLLADPWNATHLLTTLAEQDGIAVGEMRQGFASLSSPTKQFERLILSKRVRHDGNPIMKWMVGNAIVETDAAGNIKLSKRKSQKKIDGVAAAINAIAAFDSESADDGDSVYDTRGILYL